MLLRSAPRRLHLLRPHHLRLLSAAALASAVPAQSPTEWAEAPLASVRHATADASLFHVTLDLSAHRGLLASHAAAGQFLPFRLPASPYPIFLAIASPRPPPLPAPETLNGNPQFDAIRHCGGKKVQLVLTSFRTRFSIPSVINLISKDKK